MTQKSLVIKRIVNATCEEVFDAWSKPELMQQWLFPLRPGWTAKTQTDFKVGGIYEQLMMAADGAVYKHTGIYKEIIPNQKIVFTWNSDSVKKNTLVTVELRSVNDDTEITLTHELLPDIKQFQEHEQGWQECMNNLENFLGR